MGTSTSHHYQITFEWLLDSAPLLRHPSTSQLVTSPQRHYRITFAPHSS
jgi:hypothetical protein